MNFSLSQTFSTSKKFLGPLQVRVRVHYIAKEFVAVRELFKYFCGETSRNREKQTDILSPVASSFLKSDNAECSLGSSSLKKPSNMKNHNITKKYFLASFKNTIK